MNIRVRNDRTVEGVDTRRSLAARGGGRPAATVGLVDDATLARLEHDNMLEWLRIEVNGVAGASIRIERGVSTFLSGIAVAYLNQIVLNDGATEGGLRDAVTLARERGAPYYVVGQQGRDEHLRLIAEDLGLVRDDSALPGMAIHPLPTGGAAPVVPVGFDLQRIADDAGMDRHIRIASAVLEIPDAPLRRFIGPDLWRRPGCAAYLGLTDGEPVTSGLGIRTGRTIGVYTIATVEPARGRGFGEAMTRRILADGAQAGCDVGTLQASEMGKPIYERIGFRTVVERFVYLDPVLHRPSSAAGG